MEKSKNYLELSNYIDRNFISECTKKIYKSYENKFIYSKHPDSIEKLSNEYLVNYLTNIRNNYSISVYNQNISVLKILYNKVLNQNKLKEINCLKQYPKLKNLPDINKVFKQINSIKNIKHRAILMTVLKTGIRINELINIKLCDINRKSMQILIENAKGNKSEFVILSNDLLKLIEQYYRIYKPQQYLFEGLNGKYSKTSVNNIVKKYIGKQYSCHILRHLAITYIINKKFSLPQAKLFSRHKSNSSIEWYYHYDESLFNEIRKSIDEIAA